MSHSNHRVRGVVLAATWGLAALLAPSASAEIKVIQLTPSRVETRGTCGHDDGSPCGAASMCLPTMGLAPPESNVEAHAGFQNRYKPGSGICPCWEWVSCYVRGFFEFDLAPLQGNPVVAAELQWTNRTNKQLGSVATNEGTCLQSLYVVTGPWAGLKTPGDQLQLDLFGPQRVSESIQVGHTVRAWARGLSPNHGFMVAGMKEAITPKNGEECMTRLQGIQLSVMINQKQPPPSGWPSPPPTGSGSERPTSRRRLPPQEGARSPGR